MNKITGTEMDTSIKSMINDITNIYMNLKIREIKFPDIVIDNNDGRGKILICFNKINRIRNLERYLLYKCQTRKEMDNILKMIYNEMKNYDMDRIIVDIKTTIEKIKNKKNKKDLVKVQIDENTTFSMKLDNIIAYVTNYKILVRYGKEKYNQILGYIDKSLKKEYEILEFPILC